MPVNFLSEEHMANHGNYNGEMATEILARYFHFDGFVE